MRYQPRHSLRISRRHRPAVLLAAGVLGVSVVGLAAAPASADTPQPGPHTIIFKGGCGLLGLGGSSSKPSVNGQDDTESLSVPAGTTLTFVNSVTGGTAPVLNITGKSPIRLNAGASTQYTTTASGPVNANLDPRCVVGGLGKQDYRAITVSPTAAPSSPTPSPSSGGSNQPSTGQSGSNNGGSSTGGSKSGQTSGGQHAQPPGRQPNRGASPTAPGLHQPVARGAVPSSAAAPGAGSGTSGGGGESSSTSLPQHDPAAAPRPVADVTPANATSVLALIAAVCLAGVGAAAVRTVFAQRRDKPAHA